MHLSRRTLDSQGNGNGREVESEMGREDKTMGNSEEEEEEEQEEGEVGRGEAENERWRIDGDTGRERQDTADRTQGEKLRSDSTNSPTGTANRTPPNPDCLPRSLLDICLFYVPQTNFKLSM